MSHSKPASTSVKRRACPDEHVEPRTALGARLLELRSAIDASGTAQLNWDELERELADRRGERREAEE
jgi:hypothetical protein